MLRNYLKIAVVVLLRRKVFTAISLFGISFSLGILMVSATFWDHILGPFPPEVKTDRTLAAFTIQAERETGGRDGPPGYGFLDRYARGLDRVEHVSIARFPSTVTSPASGPDSSSPSA